MRLLNHIRPALSLFFSMEADAQIWRALPLFILFGFRHWLQPPRPRFRSREWRRGWNPRNEVVTEWNNLRLDLLPSRHSRASSSVLHTRPQPVFQEHKLPGLLRWPVGVLCVYVCVFSISLLLVSPFFHSANKKIWGWKHRLATKGPDAPAINSEGCLPSHDLTLNNGRPLKRSTDPRILRPIVFIRMFVVHSCTSGSRKEITADLTFIQNQPIHVKPHTQLHQYNINPNLKFHSAPVTF